jgi:hypothetical protein
LLFLETTHLLSDLGSKTTMAGPEPFKSPPRVINKMRGGDSAVIVLPCNHDGDAILPSIDDCVRFLERHPSKRKMIADMIKQENTSTTVVARRQGNEAGSAAHVTPEKAENTNGISKKKQEKQHEQEGAGAALRLSTACDLRALIQEYKLKLVAPEDRLSEYRLMTLFHDAHGHDDNKGRSFPIRAREASQYTCISAITVHYDRRSTTTKRILGFTLTYTDTFELQVGERNTNFADTEAVQLVPACYGEYVTGYQFEAAPPPHRAEDHAHVVVPTRVRFRTTLGRWLVAAATGDMPQGPFQGDNVQSLETGVIAFIMWKKQLNPRLPCIHAVHCIRLSDVDMSTVPPPPVVAFLEAARPLLKQEHERLEAKFQHIANQAIMDVRSKHQEIWDEFKASAEDEMIRLLLTYNSPSVYSLMESFLDSLLDTMFHSAKEHCADIIGMAHVKRGEVKKEWERLVQRHADQVRDYGTMCMATNCWKLFHPHKVGKHKRCSTRGCTAVVSNCGCCVRQCHHCHEVGMSRHTTVVSGDCSHEKKNRHYHLYHERMRQAQQCK